jgi:hypothetical protein
MSSGSNTQQSGIGAFDDRLYRDITRSERRTLYCDITERIASATCTCSFFGLLMGYQSRAMIGTFVGSVATGIVARASMEYHSKYRERIVRQWVMQHHADKQKIDHDTKVILDELSLK